LKGVPVETLKLRAEDLGDLEVISTCLQDALTRIGDMTYLAEEQRFVAIFSRFMWESDDVAPGAKGMRVRAGLHLDRVTAVRTQGIDQADREGVLPLLALVGEADGEAFRLTFTFAGGGAVGLSADGVSVQLRDMGLPWPTPNRPEHGGGGRPR
jgi:hypothetical protein